MGVRTVPAICAIAGLLCGLLQWSPAAAEEPPEFEGDDVIVPGRRTQAVITTPAYVTVIPGSLLRQLGFLNLADALQFFAEIYVRSAGYGPAGVQQLSIRGSSPQQVLIMLDGVPLNGPSQFGLNLSTMTLADVERVEILRGPYSAIYGSGALGGVVNIVTRTDPKSEASLTAGTTPSSQMVLRFATRFPGGAASAGAERLWTNGDRLNADGQRVTATGRVVLQRTDRMRVTLLATYTSGEGGAPGSTLFPSATDRVADSRAVASVTWSATLPEGRERQIRAWALADSVSFRSPASGFRAYNQGSAAGVSWQQVQPFRRGLLTWGLDAQHARFTYRDASPFGTTAFASSGITVGAYAQYDATLREGTLVGLGVRYDVDSNYPGQFSPRLGFVHFMSPVLRLRGGIGRTFRGPSFGEMFFPGCSNPALQPETAWAADLGMEWIIRPALLARTNVFYTEAQNLIVGGCAPRNVGLARIVGASAELVGQIAGRWAVSTNVTWTNGLDRTTGRSLIRLPARQANLILRYSVDADRSLALLANYVSERLDLDFSTFPAKVVALPPYATVGMRYEQRVADWVIRAGVDNILNARYQPLHGYPAPGRTFYVQFGRAF
ncbi:MAG TPA: TonB-dependent receptor [bacterium]|nr:TonB-dependent receptor [bacterium]